MLLITTFMVPIIIAIISLIMGGKISGKAHSILNGLSLLYSTFVICFIIISYNGKTVIDAVKWSFPGIGTFAFIADPVVIPVALGITIVTSMVAFYSYKYMEHRYKELEEEGVKAPGWGVYFFTYTLFAAAMIGSVLSTNTIEFYLFLELSLIPSFLLIAFYGYGDRIRIAIMYLLWTHIGALLFLIGALAAGFTTGFDFINPNTGIPLLGLGDLKTPTNLLPSIVILMTIGLLVKMAAFGVHIWLPYAHAEAPTPISALLSPNLIGIGGVMLYRIVYTLYPSTVTKLAPFLYYWAFLTMIFGGLMTFMQKDFKRLLAYSSISQMGYMLLGFSTLTVTGIAGMIFHYFVHAIGKAILFMIAGVLIATLHGLRDLTKMGGLATKMPYTATLALLGFMHITGIPPTCGLWSEYLIVRGAVERSLMNGGNSLLITGILLLIGIGLSTAYSFITMKRIFYGEVPDQLKDAREAPNGLIIPILVIAIVGVLSFIIISIFLDPLLTYLPSFLQATTFSRG